MIKLIGSKKLKILVIIILPVLVCIRCLNNSTKSPNVITNNRGEQFAGSESCMNCHSSIYNQFTYTAHNQTSLPASEESIKGSFARGENLFAYSYYSKVGMEKRDNRFYQVEYDKNFNQQEAQPIDVVIGSGTRGQSYLYWKNKNLYQLPISYFTLANRWSNSPGYPIYNPDFNRAITSSCLECHTTYFKSVSLNGANSTGEQFDRRQAIFGVQCESCHGPAKNHVDYHTQQPSETKAKFIVNPASFSRQQQIDQCAYCHGGIRTDNNQPFNFFPGDTLSYQDPGNNTKINTKNIEVHDNQYALLKASKCFRMSRVMTCNTCHNTHKQERGDLALFSKRCISCHSTEKENFCKMYPSLGTSISKNCIDCHMPNKPSKMLTLQLEGESKNVPSTLRSHVITIYPEETKKFLSQTHFSHKKE